ncbi:hypothetical protein [Rhodanobacter aciditrophus]|uniref:hypothetical protein n=1 Tax=Rhodanobacter aciditrophus TaxID=1623218 RepID=UPI003CEE5F7F
MRALRPRLPAAAAPAPFSTSCASTRGCAVRATRPRCNAHGSFLFIGKGGKVIGMGGLPNDTAMPPPAVQQAGRLIAGRR